MELIFQDHMEVWVLAILNSQQSMDTLGFTFVCLITYPRKQQVVQTEF